MEDYAVRAAKEWFAGTQRYINTIIDVEWHPIKQADAQEHLNRAINDLSIIIRKHVSAERINT